MNAATDLDLGPLIWVKGEIDLALKLTAEALKSFGDDPSESAQIKFAQTHLHQAHGALSIVGLDGVTRVTEILENTLGELESGSLAVTPAATDLAQQGIASLRHYLDELANGAPNQPLKLLPIYEQLQRNRGAPPVAPSDLFFPDLTFRPPRRDADIEPPAAQQLQAQLKAARGRFERGLLQWLRSTDAIAGLADMREAVATAERLQTVPSERSLWWIALGFFDVLAARAVSVDLTVKRLCARMDAQMRRFAEGTVSVAERLLRDLLYYIAVAPVQTPQIEEIRLAYRLEELVPESTLVTDLAPLKPLLMSLREAVLQAKESWNKFCAGTAGGLPQFDDQAGQIASRGVSLPNPAVTRLFGAIHDTSQWLRKDPLKQNASVAMELATALLLAESAVENFSRLDDDFPRQVKIIEQRLAGLRQGEALEALEAPLLGEMSRRAQEKLFLAQVAHEIQTNLAHIEQTLDAYFRDPTRGAELAQLAKPIKQVEGALAMLGQERAAQLLRECEERIAHFAAAEVTPNQTEFENVAHKLSGLGFFVESLQHGPADIDAILYPERAKERQATALTVEEELARKKVGAHALMEQFKEQPENEALRRELKQTYDTIRQEANLVADTKLERQAREALAALASPPGASAAAEIAKAAREMAPEAPPPVPQPSAPAPETEEAIDQELLSIFIDEAHEVLVAIAVNLQSSRAQAHSPDALTVVRRGFHTLKGSGRMVGLKELGEAAWNAEQVMNHWLRLELDATAELHDLIGNAHSLLDDWVKQLESGGGTHKDATALTAQAQALLSSIDPGATLTTTLQVPSPPAPEPVAKAAPEPEPTPPESAAAAEVEGAPHEEVLLIGEVQLSRALYDMFVSEAQLHLATLRHELARMHSEPSVQPTNEMLRAAHTLGGISATVGMTAVHDLARCLERALSRVSADGKAPTRDQSEVVNNAVSVLEGMVSAVADKRRPHPLPDLFEWLDAIAPAVARVAPPERPARVEAIVLLEEEGLPEPPTAYFEPVVSLQVVPPAAATTPPPSPEGESAEERRKLRLADDIDQQLLPIFLDEAADLMAEISTEVSRWRSAPDDTDAAHALARLLHTLKGSARMAGAMALGEVVHGIETRIEETLSAGQVAPQFFEEFDHSLDRASILLDQLRLAPMFTAAEPAALADVAAGAPAPLPAVDEEEAAARATLRVRADLIDRFVNEAGEIAIARSRVEGEMRTLRSSLLDLTENVIRLRNQLREMEIQAESQMQSRIAKAESLQAAFDPLEMDRFTRLQELTRMMAESVNDVSTVQHNLLRNLDVSDAALNAQGRLSRELQQALMNVRMMPFSSIAERLYRVVRQVAKEVNRKANLDIRGGQLEIDRSVLEKMTGPLEHLLRNAISHGLEDRETRLARGKQEIGEVTLSLSQEGNEIAIDFSDDGGGLDFERIRRYAIEANKLSADAPTDEAQLIDFIFRPGFSTAAELSAVSGRGVGMDVVHNTVYGLGGRIEVNSTAGKGLRLRIMLPQSLVVMQALLTRIGTRTYAIPSSMVEQVLELKVDALEKVRDAGEAEWQGNSYPFRYLARLLGDFESAPPPGRYRWVILTRAGTSRAAIQVDALRGNQEIVIKKTGAQLARAIGVSGATVLADGEISIILNPVSLLGRESRAPARPATQAPTPEIEERRPTVMVVDDSLTVRKITGRMLEREGFHVITAKDGVDALEQLLDIVPDVMLVDIEMPRMDGFDLSRNIRADVRLKHIPIIIITSRLAEKHRNYAQEIGVNHYLGKPYQEEELLPLIRSYCANPATVPV